MMGAGYRPVVLPQAEAVGLSRPRAGGGSISVLRWEGPAADAPVAVLAHANGFCAATWAASAEALRCHFKVIAYDARGHGASSLRAAPADLHWDVLHDDLVDLLDVLIARGELRGPVLGVGHSMGGATMLCAASKRPDLFSALVTLDPVVWWPEMLQSGFVSERKTALVAGARRRRARFDSRAAAFAAWSGRGIFAEWDERVLCAYVDGGLTPDSDGVKLACAPDTEANIFDAHWDEDMRALARALRVPGLVVHAARGHFRRALHEELAELSPSLQLRDHEGSHFFPMAEPIATASLIAESYSCLTPAR